MVEFIERCFGCLLRFFCAFSSYNRQWTSEQKQNVRASTVNVFLTSMCASNAGNVIGCPVEKTHSATKV